MRDDVQTSKGQAEQAQWDIAHEWHADLDLTFAGVPLGDVMTYDVLRVVGGLWKLKFDSAPPEPVLESAQASV